MGQRDEILLGMLLLPFMAWYSLLRFGMRCEISETSADWRGNWKEGPGKEESRSAIDSIRDGLWGDCERWKYFITDNII